MDTMRDEISGFHEKEDLDILSEFSKGNKLGEWLSCQKLDFQLQLDILKLIADACSCNADRVTKNKFMQRLVSLKGTFITFACIFLSAVRRQETDCDAVSSLKLMFDVVHSVFQCVPVSSTDFIDIIIPQLQLILKKQPRERTAELTSAIVDLLQQKELCVSVGENESVNEPKKKKEGPPPCDFRDIDLLPSNEEIESQIRPYLRSNVVKGPYENADHYLDVQFRLMREDMFRYLRESVAEYKSQTWSRNSSVALQNGHVYFDAKVITRKYMNGTFFVAEVYIGKKIDWSTTKRLMSNSLLCMSRDAFQTFTFVHVRSSSPSSTNALSCVLQFSTADKDDEEYIQLGKEFDIIETTSFYESYRYVLKRLQMFGDKNFPLSSPILFLKDCDKKPGYWDRFAFGLYLTSEKEEFRRMLTSENNQFDEHQQQAFQMALSNRVSVIQGPPGTGKTFLGLKIVKWLVENASNHMSTPVLVICYTNHALDQFLEGVLKFTGKVVRIGGQSKNSALEPHHINNIVNALLKKRDEDDFFEEEESLAIGRKILGYRCLTRVGRFTAILRETEESLEKLEKLLNQLDNDPLYNEAVMQLLPKSLKHEILGWLNSWGEARVLTKLLTRCLEQWLCISASLMDVYENSPEFLFAIIEELLGYIQESDTRQGKVSSANLPQNKHGNIASPEYNFLLGLWKMFLKTGNLAAFKSYPMDVDRRVQYFFREHVLDRKTVFKILEAAASKCLEQRSGNLELEDRHVWSNGLLERWALFRSWKSDRRLQILRELDKMRRKYTETLEEREEIRLLNNIEVARNADILGLTTTGAAKQWKMLEKIGPCVVVAEEAAEVLEAHITTALTKSTDHLILIGDHKQLRPIPSVYELARNFKLDVSMFERLITNGLPSRCLQTQHRMRPCIAELLVPEIYPHLENHPSVLEYEDIKGMASNMYFVKHRVYEDSDSDLRSHRNKHEAHFLLSLCRYLLQQGHRENSITILTTYVGQLRLLNQIMGKKLKRQVRATTVDNFQGEENDIILLSFVRSNERNSLGFLEITNRICVALSRARKGLFCIGNFDSFAQKCGAWRNIIRKLKQMKLISSALPLKCQNHPKKITLVSSASDFDQVAHGGCTEKCTYRLACGHVCPFRCHIATKEHDEMFCSRVCQERSRKENPEDIPWEDIPWEDIYNETSVVEFTPVSDVGTSDDKEFSYESDDYESDTSRSGEIDDIIPDTSAVTLILGSEDFRDEAPPSDYPYFLNADTSKVSLNASSEMKNDRMNIASQDTHCSSDPTTCSCKDRENKHIDGFFMLSSTETDELVPNLADCDSVEVCMSELLSCSSFDTNPENLELENSYHYEEQMLQKDKLLEILRSESEVEFLSIGVHDVEKRSVYEACDHRKNKQIHCDALISKKLQCQHDINIPCNMHYLQWECKVVVEVQLSCLHTLFVNCKDWIWMKEIRCQSQQIVLMPCGKPVKFVCSDGPSHADCIATVLKCGHRVPCYTDVEKYKCEVPVECILPCSHVITVPCTLHYFAVRLAAMYDVSEPEVVHTRNEALQKLCGKSCNALMGCGHRCSGKCGVCTYNGKHADCSETIRRQLSCGHHVECECHVTDISCPQKCGILLRCRHRCSGKCGSCTTKKKHAKCLELVIRQLPCGHSFECQCHVKDLCCLEKCDFLMSCNHRCSGKCGICKGTKKHAECYELVNTDLFCGHQVEHECRVKNPSCTVKCEAVLSCNHICTGECGQCFNLQIHAMCSQIVERFLPCGHRVEWSCGSPLPMCEKRCLFGCEHSRCINSCLYPCVRCPKPCEWLCRHWTCSSPCGELCDRPACDVRCVNILACGHRCAGYCGEPCPNLCLECDKNSISEPPGDSNWYVLLENCQHSVLAEDLNRYFTQKSKFTCPQCPKCKTVITRNRRFGNYIKSWRLSNRHNQRLQNDSDIHADLDFFNIVSQMTEMNISLEFIPRASEMYRNIRVLRYIIRSRDSFPTNSDLKNAFMSVERWLCEHGAICSEQQVEESGRVVRCLSALWFLQNVAKRQQPELEADPSYAELLALLKSKPFGKIEEEKVMEVLREKALKDEGKEGYAFNLLNFLNTWTFHSSRDFSQYLNLCYPRFLSWRKEKSLPVFKSVSLISG